jgi:hypothetical protein
VRSRGCAKSMRLRTLQGNFKAKRSSKNVARCGTRVFHYRVHCPAVQVIWIAVIVWFLFRLFRYVALALLVGTALGACIAPPSRPQPMASSPRRAGIEARQARASERAANLAPIV